MLSFGQSLSQILAMGDVVALTGDLGAGKTTLSRGIIQALCGDLDVPSPTYTIVQTYECGAFELWHCDLYRLERPDDIFELGLFDAMDDCVCLIEWPDRMGEHLLESALTIDIQFEGDGRRLTMSGNTPWQERLAHV